MNEPVKAIEVAAEWVPTARLRPWVANPRKNDHAVDKVAASITRFGFGAPLLARRENGEVIAGHTRLKAALKLGIEQVPVRYLDLTADQAHLLALADNKTAELAEWDEDALAAILADLQMKSFDVFDGTGFSMAEMKQLIDGPAFGPAGQDEQGALDKKAKVTCPECGHEFTPTTAR